ncbi:hypothetical protein [Nocardia tengchongensis]|uniref:hypothetical protein n=1 Tax=Nocardia tengchongensis TaxID=2055889 RepID=UPI003665B601
MNLFWPAYGFSALFILVGLVLKLQCDRRGFDLVAIGAAAMFASGLWWCVDGLLVAGEPILNLIVVGLGIAFVTSASVVVAASIADFAPQDPADVHERVSSDTETR